jgi:hypothetical protein
MYEYEDDTSRIPSQSSNITLGMLVVEVCNSNSDFAQDVAIIPPLISKLVFDLIEQLF